MDHKTIASAVLAAALAGCASDGSVGVRVVEITTPTPVPCVDRDQIPAEPARVGNQLTGDAVSDLSIVAASALELRRYGGELRALLAGCTK